MEEVWRRLIYQGKDYGDFYLVSNTGEIKGVKTGKIRSKNINHEGYYFVSGSLGSRESKKTFKIHRAVAETFLENPNNYPVINHKDGNKLNNNTNNLEFCTYLYNSQHAIENNLYDPAEPNRIKIVQLDKNTLELVRIFDSIKDALNAFGRTTYVGTIGDCIRGRINTAYGYKWMYLSDYLKINNDSINSGRVAELV